MIPANAYKTRFSYSRLHGVMRVTEEWTDWIKGELETDKIHVEISFETGLRPLPDTNVSYLGMWRPGRKTCVFEFQLGKICVMPKGNDFELYVAPLIERLKGYRPFKINPEAF